MAPAVALVLALGQSSIVVTTQLCTTCCRIDHLVLLLPCVAWCCLRCCCNGTTGGCR